MQRHGAGLKPRRTKPIESERSGPLTSPVKTATTDATGLYRLSEFPAGQARYLWLSKKGYRADEISVTIAADTRLDIELVRR